MTRGEHFYTHISRRQAHLSSIAERRKIRNAGGEARTIQIIICARRGVKSGVVVEYQI